MNRNGHALQLTRIRDSTEITDWFGPLNLFSIVFQLSPLRTFHVVNDEVRESRPWLGGEWKEETRKKERKKEREAGLMIREDVHLFKWLSRRLPGRVSRKGPSLWSISDLTLASLRRPPSSSVWFALSYTSTSRMIYVHNQVLFKKEKRILMHLLNIIKALLFVSSLTSATTVLLFPPKCPQICSVVCF